MSTIFFHIYDLTFLQSTNLAQQNFLYITKENQELFAFAINSFIDNLLIWIKLFFVLFKFCLSTSCVHSQVTVQGQVSWTGQFLVEKFYKLK